MVFLIQKLQNKDSFAIQLKLTELLVAHEFASNRLVNAENITVDELKIIQNYYATLSKDTKKEESLQVSHSNEEAAELHELKKDIEENIEKNLGRK